MKLSLLALAALLPFQAFAMKSLDDKYDYNWFCSGEGLTQITMNPPKSDAYFAVGDVYTSYDAWVHSKHSNEYDFKVKSMKKISAREAEITFELLRGGQDAHIEAHGYMGPYAPDSPDSKPGHPNYGLITLDLDRITIGSKVYKDLECGSAGGGSAGSTR